MHVYYIYLHIQACNAFNVDITDVHTNPIHVVLYFSRNKLFPRMIHCIASDSLVLLYNKMEVTRYNNQVRPGIKAIQLNDILRLTKRSVI